MSRGIKMAWTVVALVIVLAALPLVVSLSGGQTRTGAVAQAETSYRQAGDVPGQAILDRFLGSWAVEVVTYGPESNPEEKRSTGRSSFARVLVGNFVEETGEFSAGGCSLLLYIRRTASSVSALGLSL